MGRKKQNKDTVQLQCHRLWLHSPVGFHNKAFDRQQTEYEHLFLFLSAFINSDDIYVALFPVRRWEEKWKGPLITIKCLRV